jgi:phosphonate metabolism protein PhnN/1,5-bisphosphokinase (PRPP-forming)
MSPLPATPGGGTLILVVGPSGAGKDTLLDAARSHFRDDETIVFQRRLITRGDQTGEQHSALSQAEFARREAEGGFFLCWRAHGFDYGIAAEALDKLVAGKTVVLNVSRRIVGEARQKWPRTHVVQVTARPEVLRERLLARGRENSDGIGLRLERAGEIRLGPAEWLSELDNSSDLPSAVARFTALIRQAASIAG